MSFYYFINKSKSISKKEWEGSIFDKTKLNSNNYFESFQDAYITLIAATSNQEDKKEEIL